MTTLDIFRSELSAAIKRFDDHVNYWQVFLKENICKAICTDEFVHEIMRALGKTYLLTTEKFPHFRELMGLVKNEDKPGINLEFGQVQIYWSQLSIEMADLEDEFFELGRKKNNAPEEDEEYEDEVEEEEEDKKSTTRQSRPRVRSPPRRTKTSY